MSLIVSWLRRVARLTPLADRSGSVNNIFGLSVIPLVGMVGLGADYGVAQVVKLKLDNAADSAAVAAVATAKAYVAAHPSDADQTTKAISAGLERANRAFAANAGTLPFATVPSGNSSTNAGTCNLTGAASGTLQIGLSRSTDGTTFTSCAAYKTQTQNHFGTLFRNPIMTESGTATARASIPLYLDFYLMVDVSGSMGLPASDADQTKLSNLNGGCQFACHFPGQPGFAIAAANNIQLRSGAVNMAVCGLLKLANKPLVNNQYRVGIYPFINQMAVLTPLSSNIGTVLTAGGCGAPIPGTFTNLLDTGSTQYPTASNISAAYQAYAPPYDPSTGTGSGGTHFESVFSSMKDIITNGAGYGNGAASNSSRPYVFLITDGMQNDQHYGIYQQGICGGGSALLSNCWNYPGNPSTYAYFGNANFDGSNPKAMDSTQCTALKNAGATISVLYIPYINLTVGSTNQGETNAVNSAIANLPSALSSCASPGFFRTANSAADINTALLQMFQQAVQAAHLTQ